MALRVNVHPDTIRWALERSGRDRDEPPSHLRGLDDWQAGRRMPTLNQLERLATWTHLPMGYFLLETPPTIDLPLPDFRTFGNQPPAEPSLELVDTVHECLARQDWYRQYVQQSGDASARSVGPFEVGEDVGRVARVITETLGFEFENRRGHLADTFRHLRRRAEELGVLVMVNGVVGNNNRRRLDPGEFRGFAIADNLAPVVFVNNADTGAGRIFTLLHELVHVWVGQSGVDQIELAAGDSAANGREVWCNRVAAEVLVPTRELRTRYRPDAELTSELERLGALFRASTLVCLRAIHDAGFYRSWTDFRRDYVAEERRVRDLVRSTEGGNFRHTVPQRLSRTFARAVIRSTREGRTLYTDAYEMLGIANGSTFDSLARELGVA